MKYIPKEAIMYEINKRIPSEFFVLREKYLTQILESMPVIKQGFRRDNEVLRIYSSDKSHYREISNSNRDWKEFHDLFIKREKIIKMLTSVRSVLKTYPRNSRHLNAEVINCDNKYDARYYKGLEDDTCPYENKTDYYYNGRHYRSRSEMMIAVILDELGLEFKHDVLIHIGSEVYTVDFVIIFREFNRCIFIEFYGKCYEPSYNYDNSIKLNAMTNAGIYIGRDLFIYSGDKNYTPGSDVIRSQLISIIDQLVCYHVREK